MGTHMVKTITKFTGLAALGMALAGPASAYTGPGLGFASIAVVLGFIASIFVAIFAILWYPIKRMLKGRKKASPALSADLDPLPGSGENTDGGDT